jgi:hypothetical protein
MLLMQSIIKITCGREWERYLAFCVFAIYEFPKYKNFCLVPRRASFINLYLSLAPPFLKCLFVFSIFSFLHSFEPGHHSSLEKTMKLFHVAMSSFDLILCLKWVWGIKKDIRKNERCHRQITLYQVSFMTSIL